MKKNRNAWWTRLFLGVIAGNLSLLSLHNLGILPTVTAHTLGTYSTNAQPLLVDSTGVLRVRLVQDIVPVRIQEIENFIFGKLPVEIKNEPIQVRIAEN